MTVSDTVLITGVVAALGLLAASVAWFLWILITAPAGYEDSAGYHDGHVPEFGDAAGMPEQRKATGTNPSHSEAA